MAKIQKLPKYSRIDQQRPPLLAEPVDAVMLASMDLPRYQPPQPLRGRSRKKPQAELLASDESPAAAAPLKPGAKTPTAGASTRPAPAQPPAQERAARPQPGSTYSQSAGQPPQSAGQPPQSAGQPPRTEFTRQPYNNPARQQPPQSPYEKRPPFNTAVPLRREPAQNTDQPPQSAGQPPQNTPRPSTSGTLQQKQAPANPPSGASTYNGKQPGVNRPESSNPPAAGRPAQSMPNRTAGETSRALLQSTAKQQGPLNGSPAGRGAAGSVQPVKPGGLPGQSAGPRPNGASPAATPPGQPPQNPTRPSGAPPAANPPGQSRLFRLPPLDFNFNDPSDSPAAAGQPEDELIEEKSPTRPEPRPLARQPARPMLSRQEDEAEDDEERSAPTGRAQPLRNAGQQARKEPLVDVDTEDDQPPLPPSGAIPRAEARPAAGALPERDPDPLPEPERIPETPSLRELLYNAGSLPPQATILGVGNEDQLPVLLDLNDPAPGSLLVIGDERRKALDLLRVAVASVALRNSARGMQFIVFSHQPDSWNEWIEEQDLRRYCLGVIAAENSQAREWIYRLSDWAVQRSIENRGGPPVLVLFDTLSFLTRLLPDARQRLDGLIRGGPDVRIWSIAAISTALAGSLGKQLDVFDTRLWGYSEDSSVYTRLAGVHAAEARTFSTPGQFAVRVGVPGEQIWLKFRLPSLDDQDS